MKLSKATLKFFTKLKYSTNNNSNSIILSTNPLSAYQTNSYVLEKPNSTENICIIDTPQFSFSFYEEKGIFEKFENIHVLYTHGHLDHIHDLELFQKLDNVKMYGRSEDLDWYEDKEFKFDIILEDENVLNFFDVDFEIYRVPGHSPGSIAIYIPSEQYCFCGDTLFQGSVGRTDLDGGNWEEMVSSIRNILYKFPDDCTVYPGHGNSTTIGIEKKSNFFVREE